MSTVPILMYHSISDDKQKMSVTKDNFFSQMKLMIKLGYKSINLKDVLKKTDKKKFVITFDDGYEDVYKNALPIIKELNLNATCFFVANQIGKYNHWDSDNYNYKKMQLMNEEQIYQWNASGLEVGSHSLDHKNLKILSVEKKAEQIEHSKIFFKKKFNIDIKSFSYPFGSYDDDCIEIVRNCYEFAVTTRRSRYKTNSFNATKIPRIPINSETSIYKFLIKILTFYEDIKFKS